MEKAIKVAVNDEETELSNDIAIQENDDEKWPLPEISGEIPGYVPNPRKKALQNLVIRGFNQSERWQFLMELPHKLIRDIGFVIASPTILLDSYELPTVCSEMLGGSSLNWPESANWLMRLVADQVVEWFEAKRSSGRLGDHFAHCVEYVLRFSPVVQAKNLLISQQVLHRVAQSSSSTEVLEAPDGAPVVHSNNPQKYFEDGEIMCKMIVEPLEKEVVVKFSSSVNQKAFIEELTGSTAKQPACDLNHSIDADLPSTLQRMTMQVEEEPSDGSQGDGLGNNVTDGNNFLPEASTKMGKRKKKLLRKLQQLRDGKGLTLTVGEFDFLFQCKNSKDQVRISEDDACMHCSLNLLKESVRDGGNDSLKTSQEQPLCNRLLLEETEVHHWEVSVKFLLYAGPWEAFGLVTPCYATWKNEDQDFRVGTPVDNVGVESRLPNADCNVSEESSQAGHVFVVKDVWQMDEFLGYFLGPHVGETLYNRKTRLCNQLALSHNIHAASLLCRLFTVMSSCNENMQSHLHEPCSAEPRQEEKLNFTNHHRVCTVEERLNLNERKNIEQMGIEKIETLRISPRALLKGYLFYEYELWVHMSSGRNKEDGCGHAAKKERLEDDCLAKTSIGGGLQRADRKHFRADLLKRTKQDSQDLNISSKSKLNPEHWMGWWIYVSDFVKIASSPAHESSRWYIVPKMEWLAPVVIGKDDEERSARVVNVDDFLSIAAKVAEEAEKTQIPRKRQFMVAEVLWESDLLVHSNEFEFDSRKHQRLSNRSANCRKGAWAEVSRGFVVEDTWPDSRLYKPHGYIISCLPSLQEVRE